MALNSEDINKIVQVMELTYRDQLETQVHDLVQQEIISILSESGGEFLRRIVDESLQRVVRQRVTEAVQEMVDVKVKVTVDD